jgi:catechol 2,3-dioxygenase-like lactoylglutathione lyase family enzyme
MSIETSSETAIVRVSDADRAKQFYASLGWREDADFVISEDLRILQFTPPGSDASIIFGAGVKAPSPGGNLVLAVSDIDAARAELIGRGVDVSEVSDGQAFSDPDGNEWLLQEIRERLPGRADERPVATLAGLLLETGLHHDRFEKAAPAHNWWDWYAPYLAAREHGSTPEQADAAADRYMEEVHGVVASG